MQQIYLGKEQLIIGKAAINNQECGNYLPRGIGIAARIKYIFINNKNRKEY